MSQHKTKYNTVFSIILTAMAVAMSLVSCQDDIQYRIVEIPDAEVELQGEIIYRPLISTEVTTRAEAPAGEKYDGINSLHVYFFDEEKNKIGLYSGEIKKENWIEEEFKENTPDGATHKHITFKKRVKAGKYYVFAITNIEPTQVSDLNNVQTIDELRQLKLVWNDDINKDLEMFGVFKADEHTATPPDNESFEENELLTITPSINRIYSWVRRAASKVTVDFNGSGLKEGVTVYIKKASLKDVASGAFLGAKSMVDTPNTSSSDNTETGSNGFKCTTSDYSLTYGNGEVFTAWPTITKTGSFTPSVWGENISYTSFHDDKAKALPCYENMQGEPLPEGQSKLQDSNGDGIIDSYEKDNVVYGTYLEVEGYYVADRPEYKSEGPIKYRFMLGKDEVKNFDLVRNHHYKITMNFKGYGNDIDWHIEYQEKYLDISYPQDVNYQGKFLQPNPDFRNMPNAGHSFSEENTITVTSYKTDGTNFTWNEPTISYTYYSYDEINGTWNPDNNASWITCIPPGSEVEDQQQREYVFKASMYDAQPTAATINSSLSGVGSSSSTPYNLSNPNGEMDIKETANSYMVGATGWYCLPLVYGNGYKDGAPNTTAYGSDHYVNHLRNKINKPFIADYEGINLASNNISVKLIWQDVEKLVDPSEIFFDPTLFNNKGGIKFRVGKQSEGNVVIALIDNNAGEDEYVAFNRATDDHVGVAPDEYGFLSSTKAIWSWHIWVTRFATDDFEKTIQLINHDGNEFDVMPVHLGWCAGSSNIYYYPRRKCEITFTIDDGKVGKETITRTIEQYPHFVLPRGDHPYYQWGRKDPFVGTNAAWSNKPRWDHNNKKYNIYAQYNPPRLYNEPRDYTQDKRKTTVECIDVLIKNPDKWHNAPRNGLTFDADHFATSFESLNISYEDLWSNGGNKTVYDPCPPGYKVGSPQVFSGFTTIGINAIYPVNWFDVLETNMVIPDEYDYSESTVNSNVLEFYTDTRKIQSITFPITGYRDYDARASVYDYPNGSFSGNGFVWSNQPDTKVKSLHFKFFRHNITGSSTDEYPWKTRGGDYDNYIAPVETFYNCNGFAVRPVADK